MTFLTQNAHESGVKPSMLWDVDNDYKWRITEKMKQKMQRLQKVTSQIEAVPCVGRNK